MDAFNRSAWIVLFLGVKNLILGFSPFDQVDEIKQIYANSCWGRTGKSCIDLLEYLDLHLQVEAKS